MEVLKINGLNKYRDGKFSETMDYRLNWYVKNPINKKMSVCYEYRLSSKVTLWTGLEVCRMGCSEGVGLFVTGKQWHGTNKRGHNFVSI